MNRLLVEHVGYGAFPTPEQVADFGEQRLKDRCKVGYRAGRIAQLGRDVVDGSLDLAWFEHAGRSSEEVYGALLKLNGIGPYTAANACMLLVTTIAWRSTPRLTGTIARPTTSSGRRTPASCTSGSRSTAANTTRTRSLRIGLSSGGVYENALGPVKSGIRRRMRSSSPLRR